jgi:hypothetical protein
MHALLIIIMMMINHHHHHVDIAFAKAMGNYEEISNMKVQKALLHLTGELNLSIPVYLYRSIPATIYTCIYVSMYRSINVSIIIHSFIHSFHP